MNSAPADRSDVSTANLPSIIDLGRALAANDARYDRLDALVGTRTTTDDQVMDLLLARRHVLWDFIAIPPAMSLADAAVQIGVACHLAMTVECSDWSTPDRQLRLGEMASGLTRLCLSALPLIAEAAGLDLAEMDWSGLDRLRASRFYGSESAS